MIPDEKWTMNNLTYLLLLSVLIVCSCQQKTGTSSVEGATKNEIFTLDTAIKDTVQRHTILHSNRHFASFETPAEVRFFSDGSLIDSVIEPIFQMISWYTIHKDTIDLVAHLGEFETQALLVRFISGVPQVYYFRAAHERQKYFKLTRTGSFTDQLEVPPVCYKLILSVVPDTVHRPVVFGSIDMISGIYFDQRDSLKKSSIQMKFYFCSQFRDFGYTH
jgi:hypothetical protein